MSKTSIEWAQRVWNFLTGCTKISAGCKFCYMFILAARLQAMGQLKYRNGAKLTIHEHEISNPYTWKKPSLVFVNSMSDAYHEDVPLNIQQEYHKVVNENPQHKFLTLTKRIDRVLKLQDKLVWPSNLCMGVSVEDERVLHRVDTLRKSNAKFKWISAEPLIGPLTNLNLDGIDWVVVGGEAGNNKNLRPIEESWVIEIMEKCREKGIPFFFKQWGKKAFNPNPEDATKVKGHPHYAKGGCQLFGEVYREFPESFNDILNQTKMKATTNPMQIIDEYTLQGLTPFKKAIAVAFQTGESKESIADRISHEQNMPLKTAKAFVTMAVKHLIKLHSSPSESAIQKKGATEIHFSPFKQIIANALVSGENPVSLATRLAVERNIPRPTAQAYVTMVIKIFDRNIDMDKS